MSVPFQVTEQFLRAPRMAENAAGGIQTCPCLQSESGRCLCPVPASPAGKEGSPHLFVSVPPSRASGMNLFTFWEPRGWICSHFGDEKQRSVAVSAKRADVKSRVCMKSGEEIHIRKHKLGKRVLFFPLSLMSGLSNPDRFLQEMGPIYSCAFILLPAPPGCVWKCAFCRNKGIWEPWNDPLEWDCSWQFVLPSPPGRGAELACSFICPAYLQSPGVAQSRKSAVSSSYLMLFFSLKETRVVFTYSPS